MGRLLTSFNMKAALLILQAVSVAVGQSHYLDSTSQGSRVPYVNVSSVSLRALRVGSNQNLRCFDQPNESGYYDNYNFNPNGNAAVYAETWGDNYNANLNDFAYKASSVRLTGAPDGYKYDTFNTYQYEFYQGSEQYFYQDATYTQVDNFGRSVVVTGCNPWTVYDSRNYGGFSICFYPADTRKCSPGFFRNAGVMGGMSGRISSVRKGCFSHIKVVGEPLENLKGKNLAESTGKEGKVFNN